MIRFFLLVLLILATSPTNAETVRARSGEHADFSRIVLQFDALEDWEFGRVPGGYELRALDTDALFDLSRVFDLIPRARISNLASPQPGRLVFSVDCNCSGDAFEIRAGRIVVDIKDGPPAETSPFEEPLISITDPLPETSVVSETIAQTDRLFDSPDARTNWPAFGSPLLDEPDQETRVDIPESTAIIPPEPSNTSLIARPPIPAMEPSEIPKLVGEHLAATGDMQSTETLQQGLRTMPLAPKLTLPSWPQPSDFPGAFSATNGIPPQSDLLESALLRQLSRAAAQGLVSIPKTDIERAVQLPTQTAPAPANAETSAQTGHLGAPNTKPNFQMETAADRETIRQPSRKLTQVGETCIESSVFDIPAWGEPDTAKAPFDRLRTGIVGEFDQPDPDAILALAHRFLYLGFGVETKSLLANFPQDLPNSDILLHLADIVDNGRTTTQGRLSEQLSCKTNAAMWAVLAHSKIPAGIQVDIGQVLGTFSALPVHLRRHLGPWLVQRFLDNHDPEIAASIRNLMDRAPGQRRSGFQLAQAQLASQSGDLSLQIAQLQAAVKAQDSNSAAALAQLIETKLAQNMAISEKTALLASATAVEYRDSDIGRRLTRAAIRAFALNGQIEPTFERISDAIKNGYITKDQARELTMETHLRNAQISPDASFLLVFFRHGELIDTGIGTTSPARRLTAERLVKLGFPKHALTLFPASESFHDSADLLVMAAARMELQEPEAARLQLDEEHGDDARNLVAKSLESEGEFSRAAAIYRALELRADYQRASWLAGSWQDIAADGEPERAAIAQLVLDDLNRSKTTSGEGEKAADQTPIENANELLATSNKTRQTLERVLTGS